jgi:hypothetical protein
VNNRAKITAQGLTVAALVLLVVLALNWDRPDPEGVVRGKLRSGAADLAKDAQAKLGAADNAEKARDTFVKAHLEVAASRVVAPDKVEWDLIVGGGAADQYLARGRYRTFHTCFRLSGRSGTEGSVARTDIPCPPAISDPQRALARSVLLHLPDTAG